MPTVLGSLVPPSHSLSLSRSLENSKLNFTAFVPSLLRSLQALNCGKVARGVRVSRFTQECSSERETHVVRVSVDVVSKVRTLSNEADVKTTLSTLTWVSL